jgi:hypothetical protein
MTELEKASEELKDISVWTGTGEAQWNVVLSKVISAAKAEATEAASKLLQKHRLPIRPGVTDTRTIWVNGLIDDLEAAIRAGGKF